MNLTNPLYFPSSLYYCIFFTFLLLFSCLFFIYFHLSSPTYFTPLLLMCFIWGLSADLSYNLAVFRYSLCMSIFVIYCTIIDGFDLLYIYIQKNRTNNNNADSQSRNTVIHILSSLLSLCTQIYPLSHRLLIYCPTHIRKQVESMVPENLCP